MMLVLCILSLLTIPCSEMWTPLGVVGVDIWEDVIYYDSNYCLTKGAPVKCTQIEHPNTDDLKDELDDLDDLDDLESGYMGMLVVDDEDSDDSDVSGHLVIETMGLQGQKARSSVEELDQGYMPSAMDDML